VSSSLIPVFVRHAEECSEDAALLGTFDFSELEAIAEKVAYMGIYISGRGNYGGTDSFETQLVAERKRVYFEIIFGDNND
jgi:hypothetical protein